MFGYKDKAYCAASAPGHPERCTVTNCHRHMNDAEYANAQEWWKRFKSSDKIPVVYSTFNFWWKVFESSNQVPVVYSTFDVGCTEYKRTEYSGSKI